jgi:hypothetical protein
MVIGRDFAFLETRDTFPDGSCVLVRRISTRCDARATDMCVSAFLSNTLSLLQSVGTFFCCLHNFIYTTTSQFSDLSHFFVWNRLV